jgi:chromosome segregation ATPase
MTSRHSEMSSNRQYDPSGLRHKVNHHDFLETREEVTEYAAFDLERFKGELMDKFIRDTDEITHENERVRSDAINKINDYESHHIQDREFGFEEGAMNQRKTVIEQVTNTNREFDRSTKEATVEKRKLREEMADLEDGLRKVRDQLAETELENQNFQTIIGAFENIQSDQKNAEMNAVRTVNMDLKDQIGKLEQDIDFAGGASDTHNIKFGLEERYKSAKGDFGNFITEAESGKKRVEQELADMRKKVSMKKNENNVLQKDINDSENEINRLNGEIGRLSKDIESLKKRNEDGIKTLEGDRNRSEGGLIQLKKKAADAQHECDKLRIMLEKTKNEIDYLNSEVGKAKGHGYQKKIEEFNNCINESEKRSKVLKEELGSLNSEWREKVTKTSKLASGSVGRGQSDEIAKRINMLTQELQKKNRQLEDLRSKKSGMERELNEDGSNLDDKIHRQRDELDELNRKYLASLEEKNGINDELYDQVKKLLALNDIIQKNAEQIAIQKQEIEFLKKELEQKGKLVGDLEYEIEQRRNLIIDLREEISEKNVIIDELEQPRDEIETIEMLIREKDEIIKELESQIRNKGRRSGGSKSTIRESVRVESSNFSPQRGDQVDELLAEYVNQSSCPVPIKKLEQKGYYLFGTRKIFAKVQNGRLVIRVGGGYMSIEEFIEAYGQSELDRINAKRAKGQDPFDMTNTSNTPSGSPGKRSFERSF